jgi:hypothetical protein
MAAEFVEADRATRLKALAFAAVLLLLILLERLTAPDPAARVTDPALAFKQMTDRLLLVTCVAAPFALAWSVYFIRLAVKIKRSGQWPPPGVGLAIRTQIRRGRRATEMWIATLVIAAISVVVFLAVLFAWYLTTSTVRTSSTRATPCGGSFWPASARARGSSAMSTAGAGIIAIWSYTHSARDVPRSHTPGHSCPKRRRSKTCGGSSTTNRSPKARNFERTIRS